MLLKSFEIYYFLFLLLFLFFLLIYLFIYVCVCVCVFFVFVFIHLSILLIYLSVCCPYALEIFCHVDCVTLYTVLAGDDVTSFDVTPT